MVTNINKRKSYPISITRLKVKVQMLNNLLFITPYDTDRIKVS